MRFRPSCDTNILNLTSLRCLIYSYCISPVRCIDILDSSLRLGHGISNFYVCSSGTNTDPRTIVLDVVKMDMVLTSRVLVIARFDRYLVISVRLTSRFIPANIVLAVLIRPSRNLHSLHPFRAVDILDDDIKCSCILVVVLDQESAGWTRLIFVINKGFLDKLVLALSVHIEDLRFVFAISVFVVTSFGCYSIRTVCLASWSVPDDVFHPIGMRPEWNLHFLVAIEALKVLSCDGEGAVFF